MLNIAALVINALQDADIAAYAEIPDPSPDLVTLIEEDGVFGPSSHMPDHLYEYDLEAQTWALTKSQARAQVAAISTVLRGHPGNEHGQVTRFQLVGNDYQRDPDHLVNGQAGPRYITILRLWAHP